MDKQRIDEISSVEAPPWLPQTPMKPISPIYPHTAEAQADRNHAVEKRFFANREMIDLDQLSFGDLLALANTASSVFSGQTSWANNAFTEPTRNTEILQKTDEATESHSSVISNNVVEQILKTPEKPKRRKHRPKVVKEAKPKRETKPRTPRKPVTAADDQVSKTPKRKYVPKKEVNKDKESAVEDVVGSAAVETSTHTKKQCKRALDFEDENFNPENIENQLKQADETESAPRENQSDFGNQDSEDWPSLVPSTPPKRKRSQSKRKKKEAENNVNDLEEADLVMAQAAKRRQGKEPTCDMNLSGIYYDELCDYQKMGWLYFPNLQQEGIRSDAICSTSFSGQRLDIQAYGSAFDSMSYSLTSQLSTKSILTMEEKGEGRQSMELNYRLDKIDTPKKRTTGHARVRNVSINKLMEVPDQLQAVSPVYSRKKKRATKFEKSQITVLPNPRQFRSSFAGLSPDELYKQLFSVEAITELLHHLDINKENSETNDFLPYSKNSQGNEMIVFRGGAGEIVPLTPVKKRNVRPRVDLDNETDRVWKLLMENINSEGVDGSDEQKAKWWEEERNVFRGRADSFIARMHLVQGDRRFTPWKGSVVDSVVGVFLTQNVSDHLSSSAFMSLAAEFPAKNFDVGTSSMASIRITYLDSEEPMSNPPIHNQSSVTLNNTQADEEKDNVNGDQTSRSNCEISISALESVGKTTDSARKESSVEVDNTDDTCVVQDLFPSQESSLTYQDSLVSDAPQNTERVGSSSEINPQEEHYTSYMKLLQGFGESARLKGKVRDILTADTVSLENSNQKNQYGNSRQEVGVSSNPGSLPVSPNRSPGDCSSEVRDFKSLRGHTKSSDELFCCYQKDGDLLNCQKTEMPESSSSVASTKHKEELVRETLIPDINESTSCINIEEGREKPSGQHQDSSCKEFNPMVDATRDVKGKKVLKEEKEGFDWDSLRREAEGREGKRGKTSRTLDTVDWERIRSADVREVAETIKSRGMNHKLAERIQGFLNRLVDEHGSIDLEWLRDVPPDKAKEYLLSFRGLGLKSVECVRLLTLHHLAFPVDTNVGRIAVRLGWVPLQPLPESLQLHLLEMYPVLESIQKYLWPRLCKLDQKTLYELHYQMITFGKVFCTKSKPNCNACPMRGECRHFASAFASARLALPGTEKGNVTPDKNPMPLHLPEPLQRERELEIVNRSEPENRVRCCEPIIEEPASPEPQCPPVTIGDIEDAFFEDPEEIPTIRLNMDAFTNNLKKIMELQEGNMSTALVALTAEAASLPMPKLKNISQLRTEHRVYELPDSHPLLAEMEKREIDDPCSYLLAIWTPGETVDSVQPAENKCISQYTGKLCDEETCFSCNSVKEARSQTVRGTILIPCRTAMRGSFPLNGTYFQVNEVFADHASSLIPIDVPREWLWDLPRRTVYFGTSIPSIFKGLSTETIQQCFWRGYVCVRGFERKTRAPRPLIARLHFPASRMGSTKLNSSR